MKLAVLFALIPAMALGCIQITDTLGTLGPSSPGLMDGTITLQMSYTMLGSSTVVQSKTQVWVANGSLSYCAPAGAVITATYAVRNAVVNGTTSFVRYWTIPAAGGPYALYPSIEAATPPPSTGSGSGAAVWGSITGTLSNQTDLNVALGLRLLAASNLSDLGSTSVARTNLGLGAAATKGVSGTGAFLAAVSGPLTPGHCLQLDSGLNAVDSGNPCNAGMGSATWGSIGGTLSSQLDLVAALNGKVNSTSGSAPQRADGGGGLTAESAADVVSLFSTCSGTQYLGADGACHTPSAGSVTPPVICTYTGSGTGSCSGGPGTATFSGASAAAITITHNLGTTFPSAQCQDAARHTCGDTGSACTVATAQATGANTYAFTFVPNVSGNYSCRISGN